MEQGRILKLWHGSYVQLLSEHVRKNAVSKNGVK